MAKNMREFLKQRHQKQKEWDPSAIYVPQAYGAIFSRELLETKPVGTCGLSLCLGVIMYTTTHIYIAHYDEATVDTAQRCADAAIDRLRELSTSMNVNCHLVISGSTHRNHIIGVGQAFNIRADQSMQHSIEETKSEDFYVTCKSGVVEVHPCCSIKGDQNHEEHFYKAKQNSVLEKTIYRLRTDYKYLHQPATTYKEP